MKRIIVGIASAIIVLAAGYITFAIIKSNDTSSDVTTVQEPSTPELSANKLIGGLDHVWDIGFLPDQTLIFSERSGTISKLIDGRKVAIENPDDVESGGEGGLMGIAVDPDFNDSRYVFVCFNSTRGDIRVARWAVDQAVEGLTNRTDIITGIPSATSGRHSGCQLEFGPDNNLWVATGDAADESQPQDRSTLGGKILRVDRDGKAAADNPDAPDKRVYSYGHRNSQGLALYAKKQGDSFGVSVEHGPSSDDEINQLQPGNFGWAPGANYDENAPMTDVRRFTDAIESVWSSGDTTIAPSGATFLSGEQWGRLNGWLAVSVLKGQKLMLLNIANGAVDGTRTLFEGEYGRLRAAVLGSDGSLYVSTDNGGDDSILKISPNGN